MTASEIVRMDASAARAITDRIKVGVEACWELITCAYTERAWDALGYSSWDDYCTREFGTSRLRLPREERAEVVSSLRESGLSLRAIAAATGISHTEARRSLDSGVTNVPPVEPNPVAQESTSEIAATLADGDDELADKIAEALIAADQELPPLPENYMAPEPDLSPKTITGVDGKTYNSKLAAPKERRTSIIDTARNIGLDLAKLTTRIENLSADDRLAKNKAELSARLRHQLGLAIKVCQGLDQQLTPGV